MQWIASLTPAASSRPVEALAKPPAAAAMVEIRLDLFPDLDPEAIIGACPLPILVTYRSVAEGGYGSCDPHTRKRILGRARDSGALLIDLEWQRDLPLQQELGLSPEAVLLSWHDCSATPANLIEIADSMLDNPAGVIKVVPTATGLSDLETVLDLYRRVKDPNRLMAFAMGPVGVASRYLAPFLGSPLGFSSWSHGASAAPGQLPPDRMEAVLGHLEGPPRNIYGVVGRDVTDSLSPVLHGAAFRAEGAPDVMIPVSVPTEAELEHLFKPRGQTLFDRAGLRAAGWAVTTPYKAVAAAAATAAAPRVRRAGAGNTLLLRGSAVIAENTDADGVVGSLTAAGIEVAGKTVLIQGVGGAARGAAIGLHLAGAQVGFRARDSERASRVTEEMGLESIPAGGSAEILVNATPLGSNAVDPLPFEEGEIARAEAVVDMVYGLEETPFIAAARAQGLVCVDGRTMLAYQGIAQHAAFTSSVPPRRAMLEALGLL